MHTRRKKKKGTSPPPIPFKKQPFKGISASPALPETEQTASHHHHLHHHIIINPILPAEPSHAVTRLTSFTCLFNALSLLSRGSLGFDSDISMYAPCSRDEMTSIILGATSRISGSEMFIWLRTSASHSRRASTLVWKEAVMAAETERATSGDTWRR